MQETKFGDKVLQELFIAEDENKLKKAMAKRLKELEGKEHEFVRRVPLNQSQADRFMKARGVYHAKDRRPRGRRK